MQAELLAKVKVKWFYADVRAASFISRPPPYHENSGPRSVQFGLGAAGGLQPAARYELETGNVRNQLLKTGKTETGKIETEKVQNRTDKLPSARYGLNMDNSVLPKTEKGQAAGVEQKVHNVS